MNAVQNLKWQIYQIDQAIRDIIENDVNPETGVIEYDVSDQLDQLEISKEVLTKNVALYYKEMTMFHDSVKAEKKRLADIDSSLSQKLEKLKEFIQNNIAEGEKIKTEQIEISWRKSSTCEVNPLIDLETLYKSNPEIVEKAINYKVNKNLAKKIYKETGILPDGLSMVENVNLIIK